MTTAAEANSDDRVSAREMYQELGKVRKELGEKIDAVGKDLGAKIDTLVTSHEHRLSVAETTLASQGNRLDKHSTRLDVLEEEHATAKGHVTALKWVAGILGTACAGLGSDLIVRALGG